MEKTQLDDIQDQLADNQNLEDNIPMVSYIMLHRIYDLLTLIATEVAGAEKTSKMVEYHTNGYLLGPAPAYMPDDENDEIKP